MNFFTLLQGQPVGQQGVQSPAITMSKYALGPGDSSDGKFSELHPLDVREASLLIVEIHSFLAKGGGQSH